MALANLFKTIGTGLSDEVKEFKSILGRIRLTADTTALGANFRKFGPSFSTYDFSDFVEKAKAFYREGIDSSDSRYTVVQLPENRVAIDYDGEVRGIFSKRGKPHAFFRVDFHQTGYISKSAELEDFRQGRHILFG